MKRALHAFGMCQSMFCAVPCPWKGWDEEARPLMLAFLPVIGLEIGAAWAALGWLADALGLPRLMAAAALCACPLLLTGFTHLDGFMDVTDAVRSWRDAARRREILKDPHAGSFAVIGCVLVLLGQFACLACAEGSRAVLLFLPAASRCCSALAVTALPPMPSSQYAAQKKEKSVLWAAGLMLVLLTGLCFLCCGKRGWCVPAAVLGYGAALGRAYRSLEGMNGDIAGYALVIGELCGLIACALI